MSTQESKPSILPRLLIFLVIGLVIGAIVTYGALTPTLGRVSDLESQVSQLQQQLTKVTEYNIGASLPLTGELSDVGVQWRTVTEMAIEDLNDDVQSSGIKAKFTLVVQDDKTSATDCLTVLQTFAQSGIKVVIGPAASSQIKADKSYADDNKIVIISPSSTSPTLAIPDDYIFRTVGSDWGQSKALAALVNSQGAKKVIVFHRDDEYGVAFAAFLANELSALGGTAIDIKYASGQADYASEVAQLSSTAKTENVDGIVIITFDTDGVNILDHAADDAFLPTLKWFSGEGIHGAKGLTEEKIALFILKTNLLGTRPLFKENPLYIDFAARFKAATGSSMPVFSANLYDAVYLAGWSILKAGSYDGQAIRTVLPKVAEKYYGVSGLTAFDANGDKAAQDYAIWTVRLQEGKYDYTDVGSYSGGTITWG